MESVLHRELSGMLDLYQAARDPLALNRELCSTSGVFESPNAVSIGYGFMVFDPHIFFLIARREKTTTWSLRAVLAHELAHQFQIWNNDPVLYRQKSGKVFVRDKELQADCAASALLYRQHKEGRYQADKDDVKVAFDEAVTDAFVGLGDFKLKELGTHHGTAWERALMQLAGKKAAIELAEKGDQGITAVLKYCRDYIEKMNSKFGDELWPMGSNL